MEKITLYKKINYYNKDSFINSDITEKKTFNDLTEALDTMKNKKINYVENKKGLSAFEELYIIYQKDANNFKKYNKTIDPVTKGVRCSV